MHVTVQGTYMKWIAPFQGVDLLILQHRNVECLPGTEEHYGEAVEGMTLGRRRNALNNSPGYRPGELLIWSQVMEIRLNHAFVDLSSVSQTKRGVLVSRTI